MIDFGGSLLDRSSIEIGSVRGGGYPFTTSSSARPPPVGFGHRDSDCFATGSCLVCCVASPPSSLRFVFRRRCASRPSLSVGTKEDFILPGKTCRVRKSERRISYVLYERTINRVRTFFCAHVPFPARLHAARRIMQKAITGIGKVLQREVLGLQKGRLPLPPPPFFYNPCVGACQVHTGSTPEGVRGAE